MKEGGDVHVDRLPVPISHVINLESSRMDGPMKRLLSLYVWDDP